MRIKRPNYYENALVVRGDRNAVEGFLRDVRGLRHGEGTALDFNAVVPYPEEYQRRDDLARAWDADWVRRGKPARPRPRRSGRRPRR